MKNYKLVKSIVHDENGKEHVTYGVTNPDAKVTYTDVFSNKNEAEELVKKCNELDLSPMHLYDVIQDKL